MIISVPKSWNLSHRSFVSRWQSAIRSSWELHRILLRAPAPTFSSEESGVSLPSPCSELESDILGGEVLDDFRTMCPSPSEHSSTSTSTSSSSSSPGSESSLALVLRSSMSSSRRRRDADGCNRSRSNENGNSTREIGSRFYNQNNYLK